MLIRGRCHCGNISFTLTSEDASAEIPARACGCSFCTKHGGVWTSYANGRLRILIKDPAQASPYSFGTGTAEFHVCRTCGIVPVVTSRIEGRLYAVVSVNAFEEIDPSRIRRTPSSFEGESEAERLARRARNWIGDVEFLTAPAADAPRPG